MVATRLGCTFSTANKIITQYVNQGLLREMTGRARNRRFRYDSYLALFESPEETAGADQTDDIQALEPYLRTLSMAQASYVVHFGVISEKERTFTNGTSL